MPDKKLTDNLSNNSPILANELSDSEIKKALECSVKDKCPECPYFHSYPCDKCREMRKDALDLINRLEAKNSNLTSDLTSLQNDLTSAKAEVERLKKEVKKCKEHYKMACSERNEFLESLETAKAEAYKEFAEGLKDIGVFSICDAHGNWRTVVALENLKQKIDNLLKELVGDAHAK